MAGEKPNVAAAGVRAGESCLTIEQALAYLAHERSAPPDRVVQEHLQGCEVCRMTLGKAAGATADTQASFTNRRPGPVPRTLEAGEIVGHRYEIVRFVAAGGMGEVYEARDMQLDEVVALKTLVSSALDDPRAMARLLEEVRLARHVTHANVCRILELGRHHSRGESIPFLTMEFLRGETLDSRIAKGPLPTDEVARILEQILEGLGAIHAAGIVHRDVKPHNIFLMPGPLALDGRVVLVDFGLARDVDASRASLTGPLLVGTVEYMAPEQLEGKPPARSFDVYAVGVVLFEMLTAQTPFSGQTVFSRAMDRLRRDAPKPSQLRPDLPPIWDEIVMGCLARDPARRFARVEDIAARLRGVGAGAGEGAKAAEGAGARVGARRRRRAMAFAAGAVGVIAASLLAASALTHRTSAVGGAAGATGAAGTAFTKGPEQRPFPQHAGYPGCPTCIRPAVTQATMDEDIATFYATWKSSLLKTWTSGDLAGERYFRGSPSGDIDGWPPSEAAGSQSEMHGYGMILLTLMAGRDPEAKALFDSLNRVRKRLPSSTDPRLMSWAIPSTGQASLRPQPSATDGDMDMAYALLLAHDQWGDEPSNHYLADADSILGAMEESLVVKGPGPYFPRLHIGDPKHFSSAAPESKPALMRLSDLMVGHMRAFQERTGHAVWAELEASALRISLHVRNPVTGLVPDYVVADPPEPSKTGTADEGLCYDCFDFNSCRLPLRQALAVIHYGDVGSADVASKMVAWARGKFNDAPDAMVAVFRLDGTSQRDASDAAFTSPMVAASVFDRANQKWLDAGWAYMKEVKPGQYYGGSLTLMSMLAVSGNWWAPHPPRTQPRP
jgi:endo-1,4-beta-D-glucanase Y/tRNA A-37 threonylcarbamoyl transferase component Bud32